MASRTYLPDRTANMVIKCWALGGVLLFLGREVLADNPYFRCLGLASGAIGSFLVGSSTINRASGDYVPWLAFLAGTAQVVIALGVFITYALLPR